AFTFHIVAIMTLLLLVVGCDEKKERQAKKVSVISKKIPISDNSAKSKDKQKTDKPVKEAVKKEIEKKGSEVKKEVIALKDRIYDPKKRLDPFSPLFKDENVNLEVDKSGKTKRIKREPKTPLEKIGIDQLKLVAIIRMAKGNRALVEDASGKGYILTVGTYIGLNSGRVIKIGKSSLVIEEDVENILGEYTIQQREIKLQKPPGA
ncbi:MAG: pilus assembly protein PilP, partial [Desulfobacteraceae bacterium]|nr:pilus assembly protein PilP [Desulfobacteraceae bacterium]